MVYLSYGPVQGAGGKTGKFPRFLFFISHSHKDSEWLERLLVHLKSVEREGIVDVWSDKRIKAGQKWRNEINKTLDSAKVAILLVSARFLASDFIADNELPPLLAAAETEGAIILPVIVSPSRFSRIEELSEFQAVNSPSTPLTSMTFDEQEKLFVKITDEVET